MFEMVKLYDLEMSLEVDECLNIIKSICVVCEFICVIYQELNDWLLMVVVYNRGLGGVQCDMEWQGILYYFDMDQNSEIGRYVFCIFVVKFIFEYFVDYGYDLLNMELYDLYKICEVIISQIILDVVEWVFWQGVNFKIVQKLNLWFKFNCFIVGSKYYNIIFLVVGENFKFYKEYFL